MIHSSRTPTICFDATGTLIEATRPVGEVYHRVALEYGVDLPAWRLDDAFRRVLRQAPARGLDGETRDERARNETQWWFERIRQTFQATDSTARFEDFAGFAQALFDHFRGGDAWRAREAIPQTLSELHRHGCFLAVTSNFDHRLPEILEALDLARFFEMIEIPYQEGRAKPDRSVFEAVARAANASLDSLVYLGDDPPELLSAIAAHGLRVLDVREIPGSAGLVDLLLNASKANAPATLPPTPASTLPAATPEVDS